MSSCSALTGGQTVDCDYKPIAGQEGEVLLINWDDAQEAQAAGTLTFDTTTKNIINSFSLVGTKVGYTFQTFQDAVRTSIVNVKRGTNTQYKHRIQFHVVGNKGVTDKIIETLGNGLYVAIVKNKWKNESGAGKYKVFGLDVGLMINDGAVEQNPYDETNGVWKVVLESSELTNEKKPVYTLFNTSESNTDNLYVNLIQTIYMQD
jgi:hypothetical protein